MKNIIKITLLMLITVTQFACRKTELLDVDYTSFNADEPTSNTPLDAWLKTNFLDEYNIDVVYRYNRYYHGNTANVVPNKLENIQPTMQIVLDGFISPYRKIAGEVFTKKYMPKEWVLFGSYSYANTDDPGVAGTAAGGRRITLYGVNDYAPLPGGQFYAWDRQRIMHHEFGHILNQIIPIPTDWETISKGFYKQPYTDTPADTSRRNGFVTSYASGSPVEDYAESISYPLINGQVWYDDYASFANAAGKARFAQKLSNVINYFNNLGINYKELQREVQKYMISIGRNESKFAYWLNKNRTPLVTPLPNPAPAAVPTFKSLTVNLESNIYTTYGNSPDFAIPYNQMKAAILALNSTAKYHMDNMQLLFNSTTSLTVRIPYTAAAGGTQSNADYTFSYVVNTATGEVTFTKIAQAGTTGNYANAALFTAAFTNSIQAYLTGKTFVADWLPVSINAENYMKFAGFTVKGTPTNYFYGPLAY
jgi:substrate import-associated zinc metallohydrolase lipoprotein